MLIIIYQFKLSLMMGSYHHLRKITGHQDRRVVVADEVEAATGVEAQAIEEAIATHQI